MIFNLLQVKICSFVLKLCQFKRRAVSSKDRAKLENETLRFARKKNFRRVGALNCNVFGILLCYASLNVHASRYFFESKHFRRKFRALLRGAIIFFLSLRV